MLVVVDVDVLVVDDVDVLVVLVVLVLVVVVVEVLVVVVVEVLVVVVVLELVLVVVDVLVEVVYTMWQFEQSVQSVPGAHCGATPATSVSDPAKPSWQALLLVWPVQVFRHHIGGGSGGGGDGGGEGGGGDGGNLRRTPQSVQSVPGSHCATVPYSSVSEPAPPSWHTLCFASEHVSVHHIGGGEGGVGEGGGDGEGGDGGGDGCGREGGGPCGGCDGDGGLDGVGGDGGYMGRGPQSVQSVP